MKFIKRKDSSKLETSGLIHLAPVNKNYSMFSCQFILDHNKWLRVKCCTCLLKFFLTIITRKKKFYFFVYPFRPGLTKENFGLNELHCKQFSHQSQQNIRNNTFKRLDMQQQFFILVSKCNITT